MVRFAGPSRALLTCLLVFGLSGLAAAQDREGSESHPSAAAVLQVGSVDVAASAPLVATPRFQTPDRRPTMLVPLYASFAALQVLDLWSTQSALARGAVEANPAVRQLTGNMAAMTAVKAAGTVGVIFVSEKLRKRNKAAAIGLMIATNATMTWVVQHNYRAAR